MKKPKSTLLKASDLSAALPKETKTEISVTKSSEEKPWEERIKLPFALDPWQKEILKVEGNLLICTGRQVGKSEVISIKAAEYAINNKKKQILVVSHTERQAFLLFSKVLFHIQQNYSNFIRKGKDRPTKSEIKLSNGSIIRCLPIGISGDSVRGFTSDVIIEDESAYMDDITQQAIRPQLLTTGGMHWKISTPKGCEGHFYEASLDPSFKCFFISSEEVGQQRPEPHRTRMLEFLEREKKRMTALQYAQEYGGKFVSELRQFFNQELIRELCVLPRQELRRELNHWLGMDIGGMGADPSTFEILRQIKERFEHVENIVTQKTYINETVNTALDLDRNYNFQKIFVDDGGMGFGVFSYLLANPQTRGRVEAINNSSRSVTRDESKKKRILKEDLYMNLKAMMEKGVIKFLDDDEVRASLSSIQCEYDKETGNLRIYGNNTHITEGLIRAAWAAQRKSLNISISWI